MFHQLYSFHFPIKLLIDTLLFETDNSFLKIMNNFIYVEIGVLIDHKL